MKKQIFNSLIFLLSASVCFSQSLEISPSVTVRSGEQKEFVYTKNLNGDSVTLSRLDWEESPVYFFNLNTTGEYKNFVLSAGAKIALPSDTGKMYDSDWQNINVLDPSNELYNVKTDYSNHTNHLDLYYGFSGQFSYSIEFNNLSAAPFNALKINSISFSPFAEFEYSYSSFTGKDGSGQYGYDNKNDSPKHNYDDSLFSHTRNFSGDVIQLERISCVTWAGISLNLNFKKDFYTDLSFAVNPFIYVQSLDSHFTTNYYFYDTMHEFFSGYKFSITAGKYFTPHHAVFIKTNFMNINTIKGSTAYSNGKKTGTYTSSDDTCGASFEWFEVSLGYTYRF